MRLAPLAVLGLIALLAGGPASGAAEVRLTGKVRLGLPDTSLASLGPVVVYLEPIDPAVAPAPIRTPARVSQKNAAFSPAFLVVTVGQPVEMPNTDAIYHNVFSYSRPNDFDLGIYPSGESRSVTFEYPGIVKTYCSIHESMNATIVVVPTRHFAVVGRTGRFSIEGVPAGRYRLRTWCEKLPDTSMEITVTVGVSQTLEVELTPSGSDSSGSAR
jgi:plastocyanin